MKKFVFSVAIFLLPLIVLSLAAVGVEWSCFRKAVRCPDAWIGVIGDSHPTCAINPKGHFPGLVNFAQVTSQPMVWRAKLSVILEENPKLETFLIEVWPGCYYRQTSDNTQGRARYVRGFIPETAILDVMRTTEMGGLPDTDLTRNFIRGIIFPFVKRCTTGYSGSALMPDYSALDHKLHDSSWWKNGCKVQKGLFTPVPGERNPNRPEIEDCIRMCISKHVRPILLTTPILPRWRQEALPQEDWEAFETEMNDLCEKYNCQWLDLSDSVKDEELWADDGHLNIKGAAMFTDLLFRQISSLPK